MSETKQRSRASQIAIAAVLFWVPMVIFMGLANFVLIDHGHIAADVSLLEFIHSHGSAFWDKIFVGITRFGNTELIVPLAAAAIGLLWYKKRFADARIVLFSFAGAAAANFVLKLVFQRQRPDLWQQLITESSYSFPSGHAMASCALALSIVVVLWSSRWRYLALALGAIFVFLVGFSRLYLGVHYPSDVLAGWCAASAWVGMVAAISKGYVRIPFRR